MSKQSERDCPRRTTHSRILALGVVAAAVMLTASLGWAGPWFFGGGHHHPSPELARDHVDFMVGRALSRVDATDAQRDAIEAIIDDAFAEHEQMRAEREQTRRQVMDLLSAPRVDRERLEALRVEKLKDIDTMSKKLVGTVADIADVLDVNQRRDLAEWARERFE